MTQTVAIEDALGAGGTGPFQRRLLGIFGMVWAADAMQVLAVGFTAPSIAISFGLTVPEALQTGTLFFLGMLIGAALFGRLADRYGRRRILLFTVACDAIFGLASVFAPDFLVLLGLRFLTGVAVGGTLPVDYAMMAEFLPPKNRGRWLVLLEGFWAIGTIVVAMAAWVTNELATPDAWRWIFLVTAVPALIGVGLRFLVPESPMHLLKVGQSDEAKQVVNRILQSNGKPPLPLDARITSAPPAAGSDALFSPALRRRSMLILAVWFLVSISYYGVFTWLPARLAGEGFGFVRGYGFLLIVALAQIPGYALAAYGVEAWGRRPTLIGFLILSALGCGLFVAAPVPALVGGSILVMSFALLGTWGALYAFTPELYPTASRATGMGAAGAVARLGGLLAPSALSLIVAQSFTLTIGLFAVLLFVGAIAAGQIDAETRERPLQ